MSIFILLAGIYVGLCLGAFAPQVQQTATQIDHYLRNVRIYLAYGLGFFILVDLFGVVGIGAAIVLPLAWAVYHYHRDERVWNVIGVVYGHAKPVLPYTAYACTLLLLAHFFGWQGIVIGMIVSLVWIEVNYRPISQVLERLKTNGLPDSPV